MNKTQPIIALMIGLYSQYGTAGPIELMNEYNLIVLGDLVSTSEVEGKTLVSGDLSGSASNYGIHLPNGLGSQFDNALVVGGDLAANTTINIKDSYSVSIGGAIDGTINPDRTTVNTDLSEYDFDLIKSDFTHFSGYLSELASNSFLSTPQGSQPGAATFKVSDSVANVDVAVFNIDADDFFHNTLIQQYDVTFPSILGASSVVINVAGESINDTMLSGNAVGNFLGLLTQETIVWNFYEALDITLSKKFNGSLLAPLATLTNYTPIEGTVVVNDFYQYGEVYDSLYARNMDYTPNSGQPPVSVPEPNTSLLFLFGFLTLMTLSRGALLSTTKNKPIKLS